MPRERHATHRRIVACTLLALGVTASARAQLTFERSLSAPLGVTDFGFAVGAVGGNIVVGAPGPFSSAPPGHGSGETFVFEGSTGALLNTILNPAPPQGSYTEFGYALAELGGNLIVTNPFDDTDGGDSGIAYLIDPGTGAVLHTFHNPNPSPNSFFGISVAVSGTRVFISAPWDQGARGRIYLFDGDQMSATFGAVLQTFLPPNPVGAAYFGNFTMATLGGNLVAGSMTASPPSYGGIRGGAAYLLDSTTGAVLRTFLNPTPEDDDAFGVEIATMGSNVIVGAPGDSTLAPYAGAAYLFDGNTGALLQTFLDPNGAENDSLGGAVAAVGGRVVVGAPYDDGAGEDAGAIHVFDPATGAHLQEITGPEGEFVSFGDTLAVVGTRVVVGTFGGTQVQVYAGCECTDGNDVDGDGCDQNCYITRCGNGIVTAGEQCDDGNTVDGDCCSSTCQLDAPLTPCGDPADSCHDNVCDGDGFCNHLPHTVGSPCATDNNACTRDVCDNSAACIHIPYTCGTCLACNENAGCVPAPATSCQATQSGKGRLLLNDSAFVDRHALVWKWTSSADTPADAFGEPRNATAYDLCVYDQTTATPGLVLAATVPAGGICAGHVCWDQTPSGFRYADRAGSAGGLSTVILQGGAAGDGRVIVRGRGAGLGLPPTLSLTTPVQVQLRRKDGLGCWDATYGAARTSRPDLFRAKSD